MSADLKETLWAYADQHRDRLRLEQMLPGWLEGGPTVADRLERLKVWLDLAATGHRSGGGHHFSTPEVATFVARLASLEGGASVLDPACGAGLLLAETARQLGARRVHGVDVNAEAAAITQSLFGAEATILVGDSVHDELDALEAYDLVVSEAPFAARLRAPLDSPFNGKPITDLAKALICRWVQRLTATGRAIFILPANCLAIW